MLDVPSMEGLGLRPGRCDGGDDVRRCAPWLCDADALKHRHGVACTTIGLIGARAGADGVPNIDGLTCHLGGEYRREHVLPPRCRSVKPEIPTPAATRVGRLRSQPDIDRAVGVRGDLTQLNSASPVGV